MVMPEIDLGRVKGENGLTPYIKNGNWWIGNEDTGIPATGDASNKVDKTNVANKVYATDGSGNQAVYDHRQTANATSFAFRDTGGRLSAKKGVSADHCVNMDQLNELKQSTEIETYPNGIRIKKDGEYVYSACYGSVTINDVPGNGYKTTTVTFPFTFSTVLSCITETTLGNPLSCDSSSDTLSNTSVNLNAGRVTTGAVGVRYIVVGR